MVQSTTARHSWRLYEAYWELKTTSAGFHPEYNTSTIAYGRSTFALWAVHQCTRVRREAGHEGCLWPNAASQGRPPDGSGGESERSTPNGRAKTLWWWWWWWWWSGAHTTPNYLRQASQNLGKYHFKHSVLVPRIKRDRNLIPRLTIRGGDCTGLPPKSRRRLDNSSAGSLDPPLRA